MSGYVAYPESWQIAASWALFAESKELAGEAVEVLTPSVQFGVVTRDEYSRLSGHRPMKNTATQHLMRQVVPGDFIITMSSFQHGIEYSEISGKVTNHYKVLKPKKYVDSGYYKWFFKSRPFIAMLQGVATEIRVGQEIHYSKFAKLLLPLPDLDTQRRIADYLDTETAQIDAMMAKLDEQVGLLWERRGALITDTLYTGAVYGGEGAMMAQPHFPTIPLGYVAKTIAGGTPKTSNPDFWTSDEGINWVAISDMSSRDNITSTAKRVTKEGAESSSLSIGRPGLILFAMYASVGEIAVLDISATWNQAILGIDPNESKINNRFLFYALKDIKPFLPTLYRSNTQNNLNAQQVNGLPIPLPDLDTQRRIADYLDEKTSRIDTMITKCEELKTLLQERRAALITAVVTGQREVPSHD